MKRRIPILPVLAILMATLGAFSTETAPAAYVINGDSKITDTLEERIKNAENENEIISVYIWLNKIDKNETLAETEKRFSMSAEEAIQDVEFFPDMKWDEVKEDDFELADEIGKKIEENPNLKEEFEAKALLANEFIFLNRPIVKEKYTKKN